jgi:hypothetical protein
MYILQNHFCATYDDTKIQSNLKHATGLTNMLLRLHTFCVTDVRLLLENFLVCCSRIFSMIMMRLWNAALFFELKYIGISIVGIGRCLKFKIHGKTGREKKKYMTTSQNLWSIYTETFDCFHLGQNTSFSVGIIQ